MLASSTGAWGAQASSSREWVAAHRRPWSCDHHHRRAQVQASAKSSKRGAGDLHDPWREEERRQALLKYVQEVQPQSVTQFAEQTHPVVIQAMRQTVLNVVGSLPPQYFSVRITAVAESLAQLMLSIMTTGYMLRSAQFRMELQRSLKQLPTHSSASASAGPAPTTSAAAAAAAAAPTVAAFSPAGLGTGDAVEAAVAAAADSSGGGGGGETAAEGAAGAASAAFLYDGKGSPYAPGVQKKNVEGEVLRWHLARGEVERLAASDYIELLEREVAALRAQVAQSPAAQQQPPDRRPSAFSSSAAATAEAPLATAGDVEVLGPDPTDTGSGAQTSKGPSLSSNQSLACVSPLPGFGERAGAGLPYAAAAAAAGLAAAGSAAAPATMGCGGIPLVVGSPLGLPRNELLDYLHGLQASGSGGFKELACSPSSSSGQAVKEAMEMFVARLMGTLDPEVLAKEATEFNAVELSKVLFWIMAVGYTLKSIEARLDMDDGMGVASSGNGGSPRPGSDGAGGSGGKDKGSSGNGSSSGRKRGRGGLFGGLRGLLPGF